MQEAYLINGAYCSILFARGFIIYFVGKEIETYDWEKTGLWIYLDGGHRINRRRS